MTVRQQYYIKHPSMPILWLSYACFYMVILAGHKTCLRSSDGSVSWWAVQFIVECRNDDTAVYNQLLCNNKKESLDFIRHNQQSLRTECYQGIIDHIESSSLNEASQFRLWNVIYHLIYLLIILVILGAFYSFIKIPWQFVEKLENQFFASLWLTNSSGLRL